jgi:large subunit ribosomal protein L9
MEVVLLEKVDRLGGLGELVKVRAGYARNYLLPMGKAKIANAQNIAEIAEKRTELEAMAAAAFAAAEQRRDAIAALNVSITAKSGTEGKLFGSVGNTDIAAAVTAAGVELEKREVRMPNGPIRFAGDYEITLHLHVDVDATLKLTVIADEE